MQDSVSYTLGIFSGIVSQRRIARSMKRLVPLAYEARARGALDIINSIFYFANVALINGCSRIICGYASMEVKSPILIYEYVFRPAILKNEL